MIMGDKRKPEITILLRYPGKPNSSKVEFFDSALFGDDFRFKRKFRVRVNGVWFPKGKKQFFYRSELRDIFWRSLKF